MKLPEQAKDMIDEGKWAARGLKQVAYGLWLLTNPVGIARRAARKGDKQRMRDAKDALFVRSRIFHIPWNTKKARRIQKYLDK